MTSQEQQVKPLLDDLVSTVHDCANYKGEWSGRLDSNQRPPAPEAGALPDCATPRT